MVNPKTTTKSFDNGGQNFILPKLDGVVAQLVEHHNGIVGVRGSNPLGSTILQRTDFFAFCGSGELTLFPIFC